ncbi:unnamed protein product [Amoebophrya sp. A25]|nr:unnamed protein product [Amoebophrya sp. A25]|eukprot:GSA25T00015989001.1
MRFGMQYGCPESACSTASLSTCATAAAKTAGGGGENLSDATSVTPAGRGLVDVTTLSSTPGTAWNSPFRGSNEFASFPNNMEVRADTVAVAHSDESSFIDQFHIPIKPGQDNDRKNHAQEPLAPQVGSSFSASSYKSFDEQQSGSNPCNRPSTNTGVPIDAPSFADGNFYPPLPAWNRSERDQSFVFGSCRSRSQSPNDPGEGFYNPSIYNSYGGGGGGYHGETCGSSSSWYNNYNYNSSYSTSNYYNGTHHHTTSTGCTYSHSKESHNNFPRVPVRIHNSGSNLTADHFNYFEMEDDSVDSGDATSPEDMDDPLIGRHYGGGPLQGLGGSTTSSGSRDEGRDCGGGGDEGRRIDGHHHGGGTAGQLLQGGGCPDLGRYHRPDHDPQGGPRSAACSSRGKRATCHGRSEHGWGYYCGPDRVLRKDSEDHATPAADTTGSRGKARTRDAYDVEARAREDGQLTDDRKRSKDLLSREQYDSSGQLSRRAGSTAASGRTSGGTGCAGETSRDGRRRRRRADKGRQCQSPSASVVGSGVEDDTSRRPLSEKIAQPGSHRGHRTSRSSRGTSQRTRGKGARGEQQQSARDSSRSRGANSRRGSASVGVKETLVMRDYRPGHEDRPEDCYTRASTTLQPPRAQPRSILKNTLHPADLAPGASATGASASATLEDNHVQTTSVEGGIKKRSSYNITNMDGSRGKTVRRCSHGSGSSSRERRDVRQKRSKNASPQDEERQRRGEEETYSRSSTRHKDKEGHNDGVCRYRKSSGGKTSSIKSSSASSRAAAHDASKSCVENRMGAAIGTERKLNHVAGGSGKKRTESCSTKSCSSSSSCSLASGKSKSYFSTSSGKKSSSTSSYIPPGSKVVGVQSIPPFVAFILGAAARFVATLTVYPVIRLKTLANIRKGNDQPSYLKLLLDTLRNDGVAGLYTGVQFELSRGVTQSAVMFLIVESLRSRVRNVITNADVVGSARGLAVAGVWLIFLRFLTGSGTSVVKRLLNIKG